MKRYVWISLLAIIIGLVGSLVALEQVQAQIDAFTYFIPFPADRLDNLFDTANNDNNFVDDNIVTTISIANRRDNVLIYYDHWEDGLEDNLTSPVQASTQVWGDDDPANGLPPGFATDLLNAGDIITLRSTVELPRDPDQLFFDGGDKLTAQGGSLAVSLAVWPESADTLYAGAWALVSNSGWGTEYVVPIGVDLAGQRAGFGVVGINVQAVEDNTSVDLDLDANGDFETTVRLNQGEQFTDITGQANTGARIEASAPVQVHLFTGNPNPGVNYEARAFTLVSREFWSGDHLVPRSSDGDHWLHNLDPNNELVVTAQTVTGTTVITIPAGSTARFPAPPAGLLPATGVHFTSPDGRPFLGLTALDAASTQDWGHEMLPRQLLTPQVLVGWAPGNNRTPPSPDPGIPASDGFESRVYVTAATTTTINVDYDIDGTIDATFPIIPLTEVDIVDPNDFDMTGAFLYSDDSTPFVAVWGQDQNAPPAQPSIDVGTSLVPLATVSVKKTVELIVDADGSGTITWGDTVRFQIFTVNNSSFPLDPVFLTDTLSGSVDYITNTSTFRGAAIPDDPPPQTPFPFDDEGQGGYQIPGGLQPQESAVGTFDALVKENVDKIENKADVESPQTPQTPPGEVEVPVEVPRLALEKVLVDPPDGLARPGEIITFAQTITSTGNITITKLPFIDTYDPSYLSYRTADPLPNLVTPGVITWDDLTTTFGPLPPGRAIRVTTSFTVNQTLPPDAANTINTAVITGAEGSNGTVLPPLADEAEVVFPPPPAPTVTPTPDPGDEEEDEAGVVPPTPVPAPTNTPAPTPTAALPVAFLPETGIGETHGPLGPGLVLLLAIGWVVFRFLPGKRG